MQEKLEEIGISYKKTNYHQKSGQFLEVGGMKFRHQEESLATIAAISSISLEDSNHMLSFSMFQDE